MPNIHVDTVGLKRRQKLLKKYPLLFARVALDLSRVAKPKQAYKMLQEYGPKYPGYFAYHVVLGHCLTFLYRKYDAIQVLEDYLEKRGFQRKIIEMLARLYNEVGERKKSIEMWNRIYQVDPFDAECTRKLEDTIVHHLQETNPEFVNEIKPLLIDAWILNSAIEAYLKEGNVVEAARIASRRLADTALQSKAYSESSPSQSMLQGSTAEEETPKPTQKKFSSSIRTSVKILEEKHSDSDPFGLSAVAEETKQKRSDSKPKEKISKEESSERIVKQEPFKPSKPVSIRPEKEFPLTPIVLDIHSFQTFTKGSEFEVKSSESGLPPPTVTEPKTPADVVPTGTTDIVEESVIEGNGDVETKQEVLESTPESPIVSTQDEFSTEIQENVFEESVSPTPTEISQPMDVERPSELEVDEFNIGQPFKSVETTSEQTVHMEPTPIEAAPIAHILFPRGKTTTDDSQKTHTDDTFEIDSLQSQHRKELEVLPEEIESEITPVDLSEPVDPDPDQPLLLDIQSEGVQVPISEIEFVIPVTPEPVVEKEKPAVKRKVRPMVTRTVAELYAKQGEYQRAIDIYQELLSAQPNRTDLQSRIQELQQLLTQSSKLKSNEETN